jgi:hypothetical protein
MYVAVLGEQGKPSGGGLVLALEIELDLHIIRIAEENLPTGAIWYLVDVVGDTLLGEICFIASKPRLPNAT